LSEKIQLLLTDKDLAKKIGENGKKRCSMFLDKQGHINKLIEIYEKSIQRYRLNS
jgi:glycosyltransferase involved in cell wall biosynthesis